MKQFRASLARRNIGLVYGGGNEGLMDALADAVLVAEAFGLFYRHFQKQSVLSPKQNRNNHAAAGLDFASEHVYRNVLRNACKAYMASSIAYSSSM